MILSGRPTHLYVLDCGMFRVHQSGRVIGLPAFVIRTDAGEALLVDGGFPAKYADDPAAASRQDRLGDFGEVLHYGPENRPEAQLGLIGLAPQDITHCLLTHSHIDHIGALDSFLHAPLILSAAERALPRPLYWGAVQPMVWPARAYIPLPGDRFPAQGDSAFPARGASVIGPNFQVLHTPGHTPGQLSLMICLPHTGLVLIASDALSRAAELQGDFSDAMAPDSARSSARRLVQTAKDTDALLIYGHCPAQWPNLRKAPEAYL